MITHRLPLKLQMRQKGCVKAADGVKYRSMVVRWTEGGDWVSSLMTAPTSFTRHVSGTLHQRTGTHLDCPW